MIGEVLEFLGLLVLGGILGAVTGISLARLGRRGEAAPQPLKLSPLWLLVAVIPIFLVQGGWDWLFPSEQASSILDDLLLSALLLGIPVLVLRLGTGKTGWFLGGQIKKRLGWGVRVWLLGMPGFLAVVLLNDFLFEHWVPLEATPDPLGHLRGLSATETLSFAAFACLIMPVLEEMLFRGFLFRGLAGSRFRLSPMRALAISSILFALSHHPDMWLPALYLGCLLAWLDWRGADLRLCMMAHMAHNSFFFALALI
ncbi:MAG: lysostaphin resistance A-like protein [Planctomycetota bacterium]